ncbi:MAG TPA: hypothetical protein VEK34_11385 [Methylocella sp.]|nr:hypothetical protein [Methylocella sp.]
MTKNSEAGAEAEIGAARVYLFDKYACNIEGPDIIGGQLVYYVREKEGRLVWVGSATAIRAFVQGIAFEKRKQFEKLEVTWREQQTSLQREGEREIESVAEAEAAASDPGSWEGHKKLL